MTCTIFVGNCIVMLANSYRIQKLLFSNFFAMQLQTFLRRLPGQEGQQKRQQTLDIDRGERLQDIASNLRPSQSSWHHDRGKSIVKYVHVWFFGVSCIEVVEEAHSCADENGEAGYGNGRFCLKLEEVDEH